MAQVERLCEQVGQLRIAKWEPLSKPNATMMHLIQHKGDD